MLLSHTTLTEAVDAFNAQRVKSPSLYTTLCEVRRRRTGRLVGYRVVCDLYLTSLPQPRSGEFLVPLRHQ